MTTKTHTKNYRPMSPQQIQLLKHVAFHSGETIDQYRQSAIIADIEFREQMNCAYDDFLNGCSPEDMRIELTRINDYFLNAHSSVRTDANRHWLKSFTAEVNGQSDALPAGIGDFNW